MADKETKAKKLSKGMEGSVVVITEGTTNTVLRFDVAKLPEAIQTNLKYHGALQKLGDAAAGKEGAEAVDSIQKVWDGLSKGDWSVRAPAAEKISKKGILDKFAALPPKEQAMARALLEKFGILAPVAPAA